MRQIHTPEAHAITGGSPSVVVGDIDTRLDFNHPDLRQNVSSADSADCTSGAPVPGAAAAQDDDGHGTHTAGTIAAADNGAGIVGVAPNVRVAGIKAGNAAGYFFPEAVVCSFMWAGDRQLDVTNNSYFADPYEYNCRNDPTQHAIWKAEQRAIKYAQSQGVTVVASAGNDSDDVSHPSRDVTSPDYPPGSEQERRSTTTASWSRSRSPAWSACRPPAAPSRTPARASTPDNLKSFYSSYGVSAVDVTAPAATLGTSRRSRSTAACSRPPRPGSRAPAAGRSRGDATYPTATYCYLPRRGRALRGVTRERRGVGRAAERRPPLCAD